MANILETGIDYSRISNIPYMRSYLMRLNDDIRYMLTNIDPEDNFTEEAKKTYFRTDGLMSEVSIGLEELRISLESSTEDLSTAISQTADTVSLYVSKGDVTNQINISSQKIRIDATRLHVYSENFYMDDQTLRVKGTMIAQAGNIGGFTIATDASGQYLQGATGSTIRAGTLSGTEGDFGYLECTDQSFTDGSTWYLFNCDVRSTGLYIEEGFTCLDMDVARYNTNSDAYTAWYPISISEGLTAEDIHVGRNWDDSGQVRCYSVYSYYAGEKPEPDEESDIRVKAEYEPVTGGEACSFLREIRPVHYRLKEDDLNQMGVIAQDVIPVQEEYADYGLVDTMPDGYYAVDYNRFIALMAATVQDIEKELQDGGYYK